MKEQGFDEAFLLNKNLSDDYKKILEELEEKTSLKTLKENVLKEKELWKNEVKLTIDLEKKNSEHCWNHFQSGDYSHSLQMLTDAFLNTQAQIQNDMNSAVYKQQILEAENMCNLEMLKIKNSLECLAPLQAILDDWNSDIDESKTN